jgi:TPR repeat protein
LRSWLVALVLSVACSCALADEFCDVPGRVADFGNEVDRQWKVLSDKKNFEGAEGYFGKLLADQQAGRISDARLFRAFTRFECRDPSCGPLMTEWTRLYPKSAAAHLALASHHAAVGFAARGSEYANKTSEAQFMAMRDAFRSALLELDIADKYSTKPTLSASMRIWLAAADHDMRPRPTDIYKTTITRFPDTLVVRIRYIHASAPKWGGSMAQLESIIDDAKTLPSADRRYIEYLVLQEMGSAHHCAECGMPDDAQALRYYQKSVALCPGLDRTLQLLIELQDKRHDYEAMRAAATDYIARHPANGWAYAMRAASYDRTNRFAEARADYEKAAQFGYPKAYLNIGWYHESGRGVPRDYRKALEFYQIAESNRVDDARQYVDRTRKAIEKEGKK